MSGAILTWTLEDAAMRRSLDYMLTSLENPERAMKGFANHQADRVLDRFKDQVGPGDVPWAPLSPVTIALRQERGHVPIRILSVSGELNASITYKAFPTGFTVGTSSSNLAYAAIQQFGGEAGRNKKVTIPARPYLGFDDNDLDILQEDLLSWLANDDVA